MLTDSPCSLNRQSMDWSNDRTKPWFDWSEDATQFSRVENVARSSSVANALCNYSRYRLCELASRIGNRETQSHRMQLCLALIMNVPRHNLYSVCIAPCSLIRLIPCGGRPFHPGLVLERLPPQIFHGEVLHGEAHSLANLGDRRVARTFRVEPAPQPHLDQTSGPVDGWTDCSMDNIQ